MGRNGERPCSIGLDFDSVIADCRRQKAAYAKEHFKKDIPYQMFKWYTTVPCGLLTPDEYRSIQHAVYHSPELNSQMEPVGEALTYIPMLLEEGHTIKVVTGRDEFTTMLARSWLNAHNADIPIIGVDGGERKAPACAGLDLFVDDDLDNLKPLVGIVPRLYVYTHAYNMHIAVPKAVGGRVHSWRDLYHTINALSRR